MKRITRVVLSLVMVSCGKGGDNGFSGDNGNYESGDCVGGGWCGDKAIEITANIADAEAMFIAAESSSVLSDISVEKAVTVSTASPLFSVTTSGVVGALAAAYKESGSDALADLPRLSFVAVSPVGHVILVFEHPFIYRNETDDDIALDEYSDPWAESSPFTCQIFVVDKKMGDASLSASDPPGLTCLTTDLVLNTWDFRAAMIQFDGDGGVYFTAHVPQNWKNLLLKWTPGLDDTSTASADESVDGTLAEVINANICFREFLVTNEGGVLYTGITSTSGDCNGTSFLRYKTPSGSLQEITSGWWEYVFKPIESTDFVSANISANITEDSTGQILFYGPDPEIATTPDWNDACLFKFNPDATGLARSIKIADCDIDIWQYVEDPDINITTKRSRCIERKTMMGGGNIPEKILLGDLNADGSNYEIYVVGNVYEKKAGEFRYNMCIDESTDQNSEGGDGASAETDGHCIGSNGVPDYTNRDSQTNCTTAGGTWKTYSDCYNDLTDSTLFTNLSTGAASTDSSWTLNNQWCQQTSTDWRETYSAFAWVIWGGDNDTPTDDSDDTKQSIRISDNNEIVRNGWVINNELVYSSFISSDSDLSDGDDSGIYKLRKVVWTDENDNSLVDTTDGDDDDSVPDEISKVDLLTGIEVYELFADPRSNHSGEWFFNGLRFSDNQYVTGTFNPSADDPESTLTSEEGITGQIETLVIVPDL